MGKAPGHWTDLEYSKLKLLLNPARVKAIRDWLTTSDGKILPPISVELHLTDFCNLSCPWCTDRDLRRNHATLPTPVLRRLLRTLAEARIGVCFEGGGEPTLHPDFKEAVRFGSHLGLHMGLITNGVQDVSEVVPLLRWVRVSLDAASRAEFLSAKGADLYGLVLDNIARFSAARARDRTHVGVGYVLTSRNMDRVPRLYPKLSAMGVDYLYLRPVEESPALTPSLASLYGLRKKLVARSEKGGADFILGINERLIQDNAGLPCIAHLLTCVINASGDVALCEKRRHDPIILGNLRDTDFLGLWRSERHRRIIRRLLDPRRQRGCSVCRITSFNSLFIGLDRLNTHRFI